MRTLLLLAALMSAPALAQHEGHAAPEPVCVKAAVVPGFESFGAATDGPLALGKPTRVTLRQETAPPPIAGGRPFKPGTYRGEARPGIEIAQAGHYRIALSPKARLAVQRAGGEVASTAHEHGPACSGIAKIVSFDLAPGRYAVILSEATEPAATVMVVKE